MSHRKPSVITIAVSLLVPIILQILISSFSFVIIIIKAQQPTTETPAIVPTTRPLRCGINENFFEPTRDASINSESFFEDDSGRNSRSVPSCASLTIRNCYFKSMWTSISAGAPIISELIIENSIFGESAALGVAFFKIVDGAATTNKTRLILRNVTVGKDVSTDDGYSLRIKQYFVLTQSSLSSKTEYAELSMTTWWGNSAIRTQWENENFEFAKRNFIDEILIENSNFLHNMEFVNKYRTLSLRHLCIGVAGSITVRNNHFKVNGDSFLLDDVALLNSARIDVHDNVMFQTNKMCVEACVHADPIELIAIQRINRWIRLSASDDATQAHYMTKLLLACSNRQSFADNFGSTVRVYNNHLSVDNIHVNGDRTVAVDSVQVGTCEHNNNNSNNNPKNDEDENCGLVLIQNNTVVMDYSSVPGNNPDFSKGPGDTTAFGYVFELITNSSALKIIGNKFRGTRHSRMVGMSLRFVFGPLANGLIVEDNDLKLIAAGESSTALFGIFFDNGTGHKLETNHLNNNNINNNNRNYSIRQLIIRRNRIDQSLVYTPAASVAITATTLVSCIGIRIVELFSISKILIGDNVIITHFVVPRLKCVTIACSISLLESARVSNIPLFQISNNTIIASGIAHNVYAIGFDNIRFENVHRVEIEQNHFDATALTIQKSDTVANNLKWINVLKTKSRDAVYLTTLANQQVSVAVIANSGSNFLLIRNNSLTFVPPTNEDVKLSSVIASITGASCASPNLNPGSIYPRFNSNFKLEMIGNRIDAIRNVSSSTGNNNNYIPPRPPTMYHYVAVVSFGGNSDLDATWESALIEVNIIHSEVQVFGNFLAAFGGFSPRNGAVLRRNEVIINPDGVIDHNNNNDLKTMYVVTGVNYFLEGDLFNPTPELSLLPTTVTAIAVNGKNNVIGGRLLLDNNTYIFKKSAARSMSLISFTYCSLNEHLDDTSCGARGRIDITNNNISMSSVKRGANISIVQGAARQIQKLENLNIQNNNIQIEDSGVDDVSSRFSLIGGHPEAASTLGASTSAANSLLSIKNNNIDVRGQSSSSGFSKITFVDQHLPVNTLFADNTLKIEGETVATAGRYDSVISFLELPPIIDNRLQGQKFNLVFERNTIDNRSLTSSSSTSSIAFVSLKETSTTTTTTTSTSNDISISLAGNTIISPGFRNETTKVFDEFAIHNHLHRPQRDDSAAPASNSLLLSSLTFNASSICNIIITGNDYDPREVNPNFTRLIAEFGATEVPSAKNNNDLEDSCSHFLWNNDVPGNDASRTFTTAHNDNDEKDNSNKNDFSPILTDSNNALGSLGLVSATVAAPFVPSAGFGIARQQAMLNFVQNSRNGDCSGISSTDGVPPADSPTQMSIGDSKARSFVGGAVGNVVLSVALLLLVLCCGSLFLKKTGSSSWNRPYAVFARCHGAMILFICMSLLFAPTVKFGLVAATIAEVPVGEKVLAVLFGVVVFTSATVYYTYWSLVSREKKEAYRKVHHQGGGTSSGKPSSASFLSRALTYWFEGPGEWRMPMKSSKHGKDLTEKHLLDFDAATPMIDGFQGHAWYFGAVEFAVQFGLSFGEFLAQVVPANKSCVTTAVALVVVLVVYLFLCLWLRPFQERFNRIATPIITLFQVVVVVVALAFQEDQPAFIVDLAVAVMSMQSLVVVLILISSLSPLSKSFLKIYKRLTRRSRNPSKKNTTTSSMFQQFTNLSTLMIPSEVVQRGSSSNSHQKIKRDPDEKELLPTLRNNSEDNKRRDHHQSRRRDPDDAVSQRRDAVDTRKPSARPATTDNNSHKHERRESRSGHREVKTNSRDEVVKTNRNRSSHDARSSHPRHSSSSNSRNRYREHEAKSRQPASSSPVRTRSNAEQHQRSSSNRRDHVDNDDVARNSIRHRSDNHADRSRGERSRSNRIPDTNDLSSRRSRFEEI